VLPNLAPFTLLNRDTMSFGFGIGDFIAIIQFTNEIRKSFIGAPEEFKSISLEYATMADNVTGKILSRLAGSGAFRSSCKMSTSCSRNGNLTQVNARTWRALSMAAGKFSMTFVGH
jgi:hypothetical protein